MIWVRTQDHIIVEIFEQAGFEPPGVGILEWHKLSPEDDNPQPHEGDAVVDGQVFPRPDYAISFNAEELSWTIDEEAGLPIEKELRTHQANKRTMDLILAGFEYIVPEGTQRKIGDGSQATFEDVGGTTYHFGYDETDQGNFSQGALSALLNKLAGNSKFRQVWRGWIGDVPHVLSMTADQFIALASYSGVDHKTALLSSGWDLTDRIAKAQTLDELEQITDDR